MLKQYNMRSFFRVRSYLGRCQTVQLTFPNYYSTQSRWNTYTNSESVKADNNIKRAVVPHEPDFYLYHSLAASVNDFKKNYMKLENGLNDEVMNSFKRLVEKMNKDLDKPYKFEQLRYRIDPLVDEMIINTTDAEFVDLLEFCCSNKFKINFSDAGLERVNKIFDQSNLLTRFRLVTANFKKNNVSYSDLNVPLTAKQKETLLNNYSSDLIKLILSHIYFPMNDKIKINEYMEILRQQEDEENFAKFSQIVYCILHGESFQIDVDSQSNINTLCQKLSEYIISHKMIPSCLADQFHTIFVTGCLERSSSELLIDYVAMFYPKSVLFTQKLLIPSEVEFDYNLSNLVSDSEIPEAIMEVLFEKILREDKKELIAALNKPNQEALSVSPLLKYVYLKINFDADYEKHLEDTKTSNLENYEIPSFERLYFADMYDYYNHDIYKLMQYIQSNKSKKTITSREVEKVVDCLDKSTANMVIKGLIMNNFNFSSELFIDNWIKENPQEVDFLISGGKINASPEEINLSKALTLVTPLKLLSYIAQYNNSKFTGVMLQLLYPLKQEFPYILVKMESMDLKLSSANNSYIAILKKFLKTNNTINLKDDQLVALYNIYIRKIIGQSTLSGVLAAVALVPSYKNTFLKFTAVSESLVHDTEKVPILNVGATLPKELVTTYIERYGEYGKTNGRLWATLFKNFISVIPELQLGKDKDEFLMKTLQLFARVAIQKNMNPLTLFFIYKTASLNGFQPSWRISDSQTISQYIERFYENYDPSDPNNTDSSVADVLNTVLNYQNRLELSAGIVEKIFSMTPAEKKLQTLNILRRTLTYVPYVKSIDAYIHEQFAANSPEIYALFGIERENPVIMDSKAKHYKWPKFDTRYFGSLIEKFMEKVLVKDYNYSVKTMMYDSLANMKCDQEYGKCRDFYELYQKVSSFESVHGQVRSNKINELMNNIKQIQDAEKQEYLNDPYIIHYLFTRVLSFQLEIIVQMLYILTKGDKYLESLGFWTILNNPKIPKQFKTSPEFYEAKIDQKLMNIYRLLFINLKNSKEISPNELSYFVKISENFIKCDLTEKKSKYVIMNCVFIVIEKHSDLLSTFYKRMINVLPDYKVTNTVFNDLLYSIVTNDLGEIDKILANLVKTHDLISLNNACETTIKRLMSENQNGLAQELYVKFCGVNPKFKIQEFSELNWTNANARIPRPKSENNDSTSVKPNKFKVKLYDYDALDDSKNL